MSETAAPAPASSGAPAVAQTTGAIAAFTEHRGIPAAKFIGEDVDVFIKEQGKTVDQLYKELQVLYGKYKFMENSLVQQKKNVLTKIPDMNNALSCVNMLIDKKEKKEGFKTHFELSDGVFAKAAIKDVNTVMIWLGANVMLEYDLKEAKDMLTKNIANAEGNLKSLDSDLTYLKDQITTSEVNIARIHNHRIALKQKAAGTAAAATGASKLTAKPSILPSA